MRGWRRNKNSTVNFYKPLKVTGCFLFRIYFFPRVEREADIRKHEFFPQSQQNS